MHYIFGLLSLQELFGKVTFQCGADTTDSDCQDIQTVALDDPKQFCHGQGDSAWQERV